MIGQGVTAEQAADQMQQGAAAAPASAPAQPVQTESAPSTATIPQQAVPQPQLQPKVITPVRRGGLAGIVDEFRDAIAGTQTQSVAQDAEGNKYIKTRDLTGGEKWMRIAGEAAAGAAAGLAAGRGAGNGGKAALAGVEEGEHIADRRDQQRQQQNQEVRQATLDRFNFVKLQHDIAASDFEMSRRKIEAGEHDVQFAQQQQDRQKALDSIDLGVYKDPFELAKVQEQDPEFWKNVHGAQVVSVPEFNSDGERVGIHVYLQKPDVGQQMAPKGSVLWTFEPPGEGEQPKLVPHTISSPMTNNELTARNAAFQKQYQDFLINKANADEKAAATAKDKAEAGEAPSVIRKNNAEANKANAEADASRAQAKMAVAATGGVQNLAPALQNTIRGLADYSVNPNTFPTRTMAKGGQMDRETAVGLAKSINPDYDETQYASRSKTRSDFASGQARKTINALNTAVQHLDRLSQSAAALNNSSFQPWNATANWFQNKKGDPRISTFKTDANAVANEMATVFKGTGATDQEITKWHDTLSSSQSPAQLKSNIDEMLQLMNGRLKAIDDQWTSSMGGTRDFHILSPESEQILQKLGANEMLQADHANVRGAGQPVTVQPGEPTAKAADGSTLVVRNGRWVPAQAQ